MQGGRGVTSGAGTVGSGGFNGGGTGGSHNLITGGGGGASDIRIGTDSLFARAIVARWWWRFWVKPWIECNK